MSRFISPQNLFLAAILVLAAFLRFYRLDQVPPGFQFDQAFYTFDALRLLQGEFSIFFREPGRSEPLYQYLLMVGVALFGAQTAFAVKATGALIGVLTMPLIYGTIRAMYKSISIALLTTLFTAISLWHIFYSHYGERIVLTVFMAVLALGFFWRALANRRWREFSFAGIFTGLALYTYPSARVIPVAIVIVTGYMMLTDRRYAGLYFRGLCLVGGIAALIFLPLGTYFWFHPQDFISHASEVSIFSSTTMSVAEAFARNAILILGMFFVVGDNGILRNLPYRPVFDPFVAALFIVGVLIWVSQLFSRRSDPMERRRAFFILVWLGLALGLSFISDDAPNNGRILIGIPMVMLMPAWGASIIWQKLTHPGLRRVAAVALGGVILASTVITFRDYFIGFAEYPGLYYAYQTDKAELADWLNRNGATQTIFVAPVTAQIGTVSLLTHRTPLKSFDSRDTLVLPSRASGRDVLFQIPLEQEKKMQTMATRLDVLGLREDVLGSNGDKLSFVLRVPVNNLPDTQNPLATLAQGGDFLRPQKIERAELSDAITLYGYSIEAGDAAKRNLEVTLFFHALKPMTEDYTFSVKVRDAKDRVWGQEDKWAGSNSYATTQWSPGDVVVEKFYPGLNACAPAGEYNIIVEAYDPVTMQVLGVPIVLGSTRAEASLGNLYEHLEPDQRIELAITPRARLLGYSLSADNVSVGDSFALSLFWRGIAAGADEKIAVRLRDAKQQTWTLAERNVRVPAGGRGLCSFFDFGVPHGAAPGQATVWVNDSQVATIVIK